MAWEDTALSWPRRLFSTLGATFAPVDTLHAVSNGPVAPAIGFASLMMLPPMLLWAIIPFTHSVLFGAAFEVRTVAPAPGQLPIALDVARAAGIGFAISLISLCALGVPFLSLMRAFSDGSRAEDPRRAAIRTMLYRAWVIPLASLAFFLVLWAQPTDPNDFLLEICQLSSVMLPRTLMLMHFLAMARYFGASGAGSVAVALVPFCVEWAVQQSVQHVAGMLIPPLPPQGGS